MIRTVAFGEIMLRLTPPGFERLLQSPALRATFGGAEANVAVGLAHFGCESHYVTRVPAHAVGEAVVRALRAEGVRTEHVERRGERLGVYFTETGAGQRPWTVIYDRRDSAFTTLAAGAIDWTGVLKGAGWFHWSCITPALGPGPAECLGEALAAARAQGVQVSADLNYRRQLWTEDEARKTIGPLLEGAALMVGAGDQFLRMLELPGFEGAETIEPDDQQACAAVAAAAARRYGCRYAAMTHRESVSADENGWSAGLFDASSERYSQSARYRVRLVDRLGAGDSFVAGLVYGLAAGRQAADALEFAVAASALQQTIPGDFNRVSVAEVDRLVAGDADGRIQR